MSKRDERYEELKQEREERHEEMKQELEALQDVVRDGTERIANSVPSELAVDVSGVKWSLDSINTAIKEGSGRVQGGLLVAAAAVAVAGVAKVFELVSKNVREVNKKTDLLNAVYKLQSKHVPLTYEIIISKAGVENTTSDERQNLLNVFIGNGAIMEYQHGNLSALRVDPNSEGFRAHRNAIRNCVVSARPLICVPLEAMKTTFTVRTVREEAEPWQTNDSPPNSMPKGFFVQLDPLLESDTAHPFSTDLCVKEIRSRGKGRSLSPILCQVDDTGRIVMFFKRRAGGNLLSVGTSVRFEIA